MLNNINASFDPPSFKIHTHAPFTSPTSAAKREQSNAGEVKVFQDLSTPALVPPLQLNIGLISAPSQSCFWALAAFYQVTLMLPTAQRRARMVTMVRKIILILMRIWQWWSLHVHESQMIVACSTYTSLGSTSSQKKCFLSGIARKGGGNNHLALMYM